MNFSYSIPRTQHNIITASLSFHFSYLTIRIFLTGLELLFGHPIEGFYFFLLYHCLWIGKIPDPKAYQVSVPFDSLRARRLQALWATTEVHSKRSMSSWYEDWFWALSSVYLLQQWEGVNQPVAYSAHSYCRLSKIYALVSLLVISFVVYTWQGPSGSGN